jgi:barbiturase
MAIDVFKVEIRSAADASEFERLVQTKRLKADDVIAVIGKTEGNGGINDFTRILSDQAFRDVLQRHGTRSDLEIAQVPMVWSGGCDGVIAPHATVFARNKRNNNNGSSSQMRLAVGTRHERTDTSRGHWTSRHG